MKFKKVLGSFAVGVMCLTAFSQVGFGENNEAMNAQQMKSNTTSLWKANLFFEPGDLVYYEGELFEAKTSSQGTEPDRSNNPAWQAVSDREKVKKQVIKDFEEQGISKSEVIKFFGEEDLHSTRAIEILSEFKQGEIDIEKERNKNQQ